MNAEAFRCYTLGIPEIDAQHWDLIELLNKIQTQYRVDTIFDRTLLVDIKEALQHHFSSEEQYMKDINFPYIEYHAAAHEKIIIKMEIIIKSSTDKWNSLIYIIGQLKEIIYDHIDHYDMQIGVFINK